MSSKFFSQAWANAGDKTVIPNVVQPGGEVSYPEGYGSDYQLDQETNPDAKDVERQIDNQLRFDMTELLKELQESGMINYSAIYDYPVGAFTKGTDFLQYRCLIVNGPSSSVVDPVGDTTGRWIGADMTSVYPATVGAADVFTAASLPTTFVIDQEFHVSFDDDNTGACTLNGISIKNLLAQDPLPGEIGPSRRVELVYDGTNFVFQNGLLHTLVSRATNFSIANSTNTEIPGFVLEFDSANALTGTAAQIVTPAGVSHIQVSAKIDWEANVTGIRRVRILKNGSLLFAGRSRDTIIAATGGNESDNNLDQPWLPTVSGDIWTVEGFQDSGVALNVQGNASGSGSWFYAEFK